MLIAVRGGGSPLVIGAGDREAFLASDIPALLGREPRRRRARRRGRRHPDARQRSAFIGSMGGRCGVRRRPIAMSDEAVERNGFPHFMLKEIFEQPDAVRNTLAERIEPSKSEVELRRHRPRRSRSRVAVARLLHGLRHVVARRAGRQVPR